MVFHQFYSFCIFLYLIFISYSAPTFQSCSTEESAVVQGKCSRYVNDFISATNKLNLGIEYNKNVSSACEKITNCYGQSECPEARKNYKLYQLKCEKTDFDNYDMDNCLQNIFFEIYEGNFECTKDFNYFSFDMRIKRQAYTSGKSCLLRIANKKCSAKANTYMNTKYSTLLDILTVPSDDGTCTSIRDYVISQQCVPQQTIIGRKLGGNYTELCDSLKECMNSFCFFDPKDYEYAKMVCQRAINSTNENEKSGSIEFAFCYAKVALKSDSQQNLECIRKASSNETSSSHMSPKTVESSNSTVSANKMSDEEVEKFLKNKDCMKKAMGRECDETILKMFDAEWEQLQKDEQRWK